MRRKILVVLLAIPLFLLGLGVAGPLLLIDKGLSRYQGQERKYAEFIWKYARMSSSGSGEAFFVTGIKVTEVKKVGEKGECGEDPQLAKGQYTGKVQTYTFFGIPYTLFTFNCNYAIASGRRIGGLGY